MRAVAGRRRFPRVTTSAPPIARARRTRAALVLLAAALPLACGGGGGVAGRTPEELAQHWSGAGARGRSAPAPRCRATRPDGGALPKGARWCEWPTTGSARGRVTGTLYAPLVTRAATAAVAWERPVADDGDGARALDSLARALAARGITERPCRPPAGAPADASGTSRLFGSDRMIVHVARRAAADGGSALVVTALDEPTALDAIPCRRR